jgi:hypothetical protein
MQLHLTKIIQTKKEKGKEKIRKGKSKETKGKELRYRRGEIERKK